MGTCRFPTCLQHNISRQIIKDDPGKGERDRRRERNERERGNERKREKRRDREREELIVFLFSEFKGYVALKCSEQCSIAFHPNCWKKQKALLGFYNEKNIASANCVTPDCPGVITYVALFDSESKPRVRSCDCIVK